jgi:hypothetical protein
MQIEHDIFSGLGHSDLIDSSKSNNATEVQGASNATDSKSLSKGRYECIKQALDGISIIPIQGDLKTMKKKKYQNRFDHVFLSQHCAHWIGLEEFKSILRSKQEEDQNGEDDPRKCVSSVDVETGKFIFQLNEKDQMALLDKIKALAEKNNFVPLYDEMCELELNTLSFTLNHQNSGAPNS